MYWLLSFERSIAIVDKTPPQQNDDEGMADDARL